MVFMLLIAAWASTSLGATSPFKVSLPKGFTAAAPATNGPARVFAYSRPSVAPNVKTLFQVTVIAIPPEGRGDSLESLLAGMLRGVERRRTEFKKSDPVKTRLGSLEAAAVDWEGKGEGHDMRGRMLCAVSDGTLFCVHFQDVAQGWEKSQSELNKALETFTVSK